MTFLEQIFERLQRAVDAPVVREIRDGQIVSITGAELLAMTEQAREMLAWQGLQKGDRCVLLAPNSIRWIALDLALMAEGVIVVPLYARQALAELVVIMKDSAPARIFCYDPATTSEIQKLWPQAPPICAFDLAAAHLRAARFPTPASTTEKMERVIENAPNRNVRRPPLRQDDSDPVTIIYTSGTSGEPKGVVLNAGNITFMLGCANGRLDLLMGARNEPEQVFQYTPFCFAASWIVLLTVLSRNSVVTLSTDLTKLSDELKIASPEYFLNVPTLLERLRTKIQDSVTERGGLAKILFSRAQQAFVRRHNQQGTWTDSVWLGLANTLMFRTIHNSVGPNLKALICGSAPLSLETQLFFMMIGIPVLQAYGLTETTAICTADDPRHVEPGYVGPAIPGIEMKCAENGEILVRGPNIFAGYWQRPAETTKALDGGWFHTGDQGEVNENGKWRITGRIKNLIILNSGHNIAPEPIEEKLAQFLPEVQQVVLIGNQRSFLAALVSTTSNNGLTDAHIQSAIESVNAALPHYKQIRAFQKLPEPLTMENGLLTTMGKLKRDAIAAHFANEIDALYRKKTL
ncbi:MAG: AMP-binding protein [Candidatus Acidiferrales bacterium]